MSCSLESLLSCQGKYHCLQKMVHCNHVPELWTHCHMMSNTGTSVPRIPIQQEWLQNY